MKSKSLEVSPNDRESIFYVEVNKVVPNPQQPRENFNESGIQELAQSIKRYGILQPLLVSKLEQEKERGLEVKYQLIAGERRFRAAKLLGLPQVPVIIKDVPENITPKASLEMALVENVQRKDLNPIEEGKAFAQLRDRFGLSYAEIAKRVGKSAVAVTNTVRLLGLPEEIQTSILKGNLTEGHGRALLGVADETKRYKLFKTILTNGLSVRDVEAVASESIRESKKEAVKSKTGMSKFQELEQNLTGNLGVPVGIRTDATGKGKILIRFATHEELNSVVEKILD